MKKLTDHIPADDKNLIDVLGLWAMIGVFFDFLPEVVLLLTAIWTGLRIYETTTVQKLFGKEVSDAEESKSD